MQEDHYEWEKELPKEELMKCSCGAIWPKPAKFCGYCGRKLETVNIEQIEASIGHPIDCQCSTCWQAVEVK